MTAQPLLLAAPLLLFEKVSAFVPSVQRATFTHHHQKATRDVLTSSPATIARQDGQTSLNLIDPSSTFDIAASADNMLDDTSTKLLISIGLTVAAVAGALLVDQSTDDTGATDQSLDAKYTDPEQLRAEYQAREEALQLAMEREAELALAEERGEFNKTQADAEMVEWKLAEGGSDPAGIQSSLPEEEERKVREMIAEQRRMEEEGVFDDDNKDANVPDIEASSDTRDDVEKEVETVDEISTSPSPAAVDMAAADPLTLVKMMEDAKAQDEAAGKLDVAARIADRDSEIEQQARNILAVEFAAMEEVQDRARKEKEEKRIADLKEGQKMLDLMAQTRQTEVDALQSLMQQSQKEDLKREADASQLEDDRLKMELNVAKGRYGLSDDGDDTSAVDTRVDAIQETAAEAKAKAEAQKLIDDEEDRYLAEVAAQEARDEVERKLEEEARELEQERLRIEQRVATSRQLYDERTNQELNEAMKLASNSLTVSETQASAAQILEAERAVQAEKKRVQMEERAKEMERQRAAEAKRAREFEKQRAADIAKAQIERDMAMVRKYNEERKAKAAEAVAAADKRRAQMSSMQANGIMTKAPQTLTTIHEDIKKDIPDEMWVSEEEKDMLGEKELALEEKRGRKRDKVAKFVKNKKVIGAGLAYMVGKKLLNTLFL